MLRFRLIANFNSFMRVSTQSSARLPGILADGDTTVEVHKGLATIQVIKHGVIQRSRIAYICYMGAGIFHTPNALIATHVCELAFEPDDILVRKDA